MRKRRNDSFFGMHFDFHAGIHQTNIGANSNPDAIDRMLEAVKPDFVQCDTKGHAGASSYPTKVGYPAPDIQSDILKMWRETTAAHDVALYAHYSGVWDNNAVAHHPEWAAVGANGVPSTEKISVFGPYADKLLIPQLLEMAIDYKLDGVWVDGECWAVMVDYSQYAVEAYRKKHASEPPAPEDENYEEYLRFCRDGFRAYLKHYVTEVHNIAPDFQIASNWMYTSFAPEEPLIAVDFISGDYSPNDSINTARFEGRCLVHQQKPWDLMAWGFSYENGVRCVKNYEQLCQEAAAVISLGGGFQLYNKQCIGTIQEWAVPMWAKLASFCREREEYCHKAEPVPQTAILFSEKAWLMDKRDLFTCYSSAYAADMRGLLYAVLDNRYSAEILMTHHVLNKQNLHEYGLIILPNLETIEADVKAKLLDYVNTGGKLLITGHMTAQVFLPYLDIDITGGSTEPETIYIEGNEQYAPLRTSYRDVVPTSAEVTGYFYFNDDPTGERKIASTITQYGEGRIAGIYFDMGVYQYAKTTALRDFVGGVLNSVFTPAVRVKGAGELEVSLMRKNGLLCVNLLNLEGRHSDGHYKNFAHVPSLRRISVEIDFPYPPQSVMLEPLHLPLAYTYENHTIRTEIEELPLHAILTIL